MNCFPNYNPNQLIPIGRLTNRYIYDEIPYQIPPLQRKLSVIKSSNANIVSKRMQYSYLINNPPKIYGTQSDVYTNPNTLNIPRINSGTISINNNPTCPYVYPIDMPLMFPSNQPSVIYPTDPVPPTTIPPCINYTALSGGSLVLPFCINPLPS